MTNGEAHKMPFIPNDGLECLFGYVLHPNVTISHTTRAYIRERTTKRKKRETQKNRTRKTPYKSNEIDLSGTSILMVPTDHSPLA